MTIFAQHFGPGPVARDVMLTVGLVRRRCSSCHSRNYSGAVRNLEAHNSTLGVLSLIGLAAIVWSVSEPISRLTRQKKTSDTVNSIHQFCLTLSDADLQGFGVRLDTDTWERVPPDGYDRLIARAKRQGQLSDGGGNWTKDGQLVDSWHRPFGIAVAVQGGKRVVIVESAGPDGQTVTIDDTRRSGS